VAANTHFRRVEVVVPAEAVDIELDAVADDWGAWLTWGQVGGDFVLRICFGLRRSDFSRQ
jgi:hypothetical protein